MRECMTEMIPEDNIWLKRLEIRMYDNLARSICITEILNRNEHNIISYEVNDLKDRIYQE
jgi:hypothetical protein